MLEQELAQLHTLNTERKIHTILKVNYGNLVGNVD